MDYKIQLRDIMKEHVGTKAILYTTDGTWYSYLSKGAIPGTLTTIDFGVTYQRKQCFGFCLVYYNILFTVCAFTIVK